MSDLLKINRNGQILDIALDRPEARCPLDSNLGLVGRMMAPGGYSPDELLLTLTPYPNMPPYSIEGMHFYTFNQIKSTEK